MIFLLLATIFLQSGSLNEGVSVKYYSLDSSLRKIRTLMPNQKPNIHNISSNIHWRGDKGDFPLAENFLMEINGYINSPESGEHYFQLASDDGSVMWFNGEKIIDNDGEHGTTSVGASVVLKAGVPSKFKIVYFQSAGEKDLWLRWKKPSDNSFNFITESVLFHDPFVPDVEDGLKKTIRPLSKGSAGDGSKLISVHPSYSLKKIRPDNFKPRVGDMDWLSDGRMVLCTWDANGCVYIVDGVKGNDIQKVNAKRIAGGLAEPIGIAVHDDRIFVLQKQELTELIDHNGDEVIDEYRNVCNSWSVTANFHEFSFGLVAKDGYLWGNLAIAIEPGGASTWPQAKDRGKTIKIDPDTGEYELVTSGLRTPNGIGEGTDGELYLSDNQGDWLPVSKILHYSPGAFYESRAVEGKDAKYPQVKKPVVWLPQDEIGNSPGNIQPLNNGKYINQMIHTDIHHGGIKRVFTEKIKGEYQGCVFRFSQGLEAGTNRVLIGPEGSIYCGGIGSSGNWSQSGKLWYGLERLDFNGKSTFEMLAIRSKANGFEVEFTEPVSPGLGEDPAFWFCEHFTYEPTEEYGGPKINKSRTLIKSITPSNDRRKFFLEIDNLKPNYVYYIRLLGPWRSESNSPIWTTESWYTLNAISEIKGKVNSYTVQKEHNVLSSTEKEDGWELLFDGKSLDGWRNFKKSNIKSEWSVEQECLVIRAGGGDIITKKQYENFEFQIEWAVEDSGNSGIFFNVIERSDTGAPWETGPEMQILDNSKHADGENPFTSAGACYALYAPDRDDSYPPGVFNKAKIIQKDGYVTLWLNDFVQCKFDLKSQEFKDKVKGSKFAAMPHFGRSLKGHISLQDHGDTVRFRNIKIKELR